MEITTWTLVLILYTSKGEPTAMTAVRDIPSGYDCTEIGKLWVARGPGKKGFQCLPMGSDESPKDGAK